MKAHFNINLIVLSVFLLVSTAKASVVDEYQVVDLDAFIDRQQPLKKGKRFIVKPKGIKIQAELVTMPEKKQIKYAYTALMMMNVNPLPSIEHRLFIRSSAGKVISVYVTEQGEKKITEQLKVGETVLFSGYHIYNYRLGPAIVVEDFTRP